MCMKHVDLFEIISQVELLCFGVFGVQGFDGSLVLCAGITLMMLFFLLLYIKSCFDFL